MRRTPRKRSAASRSDGPDAVVLDVMFPENDKAGFEAARAIRRGFGELPFLLLTAATSFSRSASAKRNSIRLGARRSNSSKRRWNSTS